MKILKKALSLFLTFFKIGLFTFGGGYAMIAVIEREIVEKKCVQWYNLFTIWERKFEFVGGFIWKRKTIMFGVLV